MASTGVGKRSVVGSAVYHFRVALALNMLNPVEEGAFYAATLLLLGLLVFSAYKFVLLLLP